MRKLGKKGKARPVDRWVKRSVASGQESNLSVAGGSQNMTNVLLIDTGIYPLVLSLLNGVPNSNNAPPVQWHFLSVLVKHGVLLWPMQWKYFSHGLQPRVWDFSLAQVGAICHDHLFFFLLLSMASHRFVSVVELNLCEGLYPTWYIFLCILWPLNSRAFPII